MAKLAIIFEYEPNPVHYPDCDTVAECLEYDVNSLNEGEMDPAEMLSVYEWEAKILDE